MESPLGDKNVGIKREYLATQCEMKSQARDGASDAKCLKSWMELMEATTGIEPVCTDLQSMRQTRTIN